MAVLPNWAILDPLLRGWLLEDLGRGDRATDAIAGGAAANGHLRGRATWTAKAAGVVAGLPIAGRVFRLLDERVEWEARVADGDRCAVGQVVATARGPLDALLSGERVALNLAMRLSGIATLTRTYVDRLEPSRRAGFPAQLADTRKTTPGLRILEKYAVRAGGAVNHRAGLDDAAMVKDNHIAAAGGVAAAVAAVRRELPYPLTVEVEAESLEQAIAAIAAGADIVMLDNMPPDRMRAAVAKLREMAPQVKLEASGNVTLETLPAVAETGVDYISTSALVTRSPWLDLSMKVVADSGLPQV